jgi:hypothetical protein
MASKTLSLKETLIKTLRLRGFARNIKHRKNSTILKSLTWTSPDVSGCPTRTKQVSRLNFKIPKAVIPKRFYWESEFCLLDSCLKRAGMTRFSVLQEIENIHFLP